MEENKKEELLETGSIKIKKIKIFTIIGEIEGHELAAQNTKTTKYEHLLPQLAEVEESDEIEGALFLLNTLGGDVEALGADGHGAGRDPRGFPP